MMSPSLSSRLLIRSRWPRFYPATARATGRRRSPPGARPTIAEAVFAPAPDASECVAPAPICRSICELQRRTIRLMWPCGMIPPRSRRPSSTCAASAATRWSRWVPGRPARSRSRSPQPIRSTRRGGSASSSSFVCSVMQRRNHPWSRLCAWTNATRGCPSWGTSVLNQIVTKLAGP